MAKKLTREFTVIVEQDEEGFFVGTVPELKGCQTQAKSSELASQMAPAVIPVFRLRLRQASQKVLNVALWLRLRAFCSLSLSRSKIRNFAFVAFMRQVLDKLMERVKEAIRLCLEVEGETGVPSVKLIGIQRVSV